MIKKKCLLVNQKFNDNSKLNAKHDYTVMIKTSSNTLLNKFHYNKKQLQQWTIIIPGIWHYTENYPFYQKHSEIK
jgi:hypothetical protein